VLSAPFGLTLDRIDLLERIGAGASGEVFRARERRSGKPIAAKVYTFAGVDPAYRARERFWRECQALAALHDPAFPMLFGCGETPDGGAYALMEWIDGRPLDDYRGAPVDFVLKVAVRILLALRALHRAGFVHRDLAFDNVLVEERRSGPQPRLIDLGAAKDLAANEDLTLPGSFLGRPAYAPPESLTALGSTAVRDGRADVFALGVLLYEWLSGEPPFAGSTPVEVARNQTRRGLSAPAVPPQRGVAGDEVPRWVLGLLARDVPGRPDAATALHQLLQIRRRLPGARVSMEVSTPEELVEERGGRDFWIRPRSFPSEPFLPRLSDLSVPEASDSWLEARPVPPAAARVAPPAPSGLVEGTALQVGQGDWASRLFLAVGFLALLAAAAFAVYVLRR